MSEFPAPEDEGRAARKRIEEDQKKAREQMRKDSLLVKGPVEVTFVEGETLTLAQLNAIAEQANAETHDIIHKTVVQVARVTKDVMKGVGVGSEQHKRFAKRAGAQAALDVKAKAETK